MAHILAFLFNYASRQYHEVWALQFLFLHTIRDTVSPSEAFMVALIWTYQRYSSNLYLACHSPQPIWKPKPSLHYNVQKYPVPHSSSVPLARKSHFNTWFESFQEGRKYLRMDLTGPGSKKNGDCGVGIPDVLQCTTSETSSYQLCRFIIFLNFGSVKNITFKRLVSNVEWTYSAQVPSSAILYLWTV